LLKTLGLFVTLLLGVGLMAYYAFQLPEVQTSLTQQATSWLSHKLGGNVSVGQTRISWLDEITFEDVNIKDLKGRDMIFVRELYVNCKTNFTFDLKNLVKFDNNLDYVMLKNPEVKLFKEANGRLNIDDWIVSIEKLSADSTKKSIPNRNKAFTLDNAYIKNGFVSITDLQKARFPENRFDYNNFKFENINANLEKVLILGDTVAFKTTSLNAIEKRSDLTVKNIKTDFLYCKTAMLLNNLHAFINQSYIGNSLHFYYQKPSAFNNFFTKVSMKGQLKNTVFDAQDLGRFAPEMYAFRERYHLDAEMTGRYVDLFFKNFRLKFGQNTHLSGTVNFKGFPDLRNTITDLKLADATIHASDVKQYSQEPAYQKYIAKAEKVLASGTFVGTYNNFVSNANLTSSGLGKAKGLIHVKIAPVSSQSTYFGDLDISQLELGKLLDQPETLQKISFKGKINGKGLEIDNATLGLDGVVSSIGYNGYNYQNITIDGQLGQSIFDGFVDIKDPNISADVKGIVDFNAALNSFKIKGNVYEADLEKLGFSDKNLHLKTQINFDFIGNKLDDWIGKAQFLNTELRENNRQLVADSLFFYSSIKGESRRFSVISEYLNCQIEGKFEPSQLINDTKTLVKEYDQLFSENEEQRLIYYQAKRQKKFIQPYQVQYKLSFKHTQPFFNFFAPLYFISAGSEVAGKLEIAPHAAFTLKGKLDTLRYKTNEFYEAKLAFDATKPSFDDHVAATLKIHSDKQKIANDLLTENLTLNGLWNQPATILLDAAIEQKSTNSYAKIWSEVGIVPDGLEIKFNDRLSVINLIDKKWKLEENNQISILKDLVHFSNLKLSNQSQSVSLNGAVSQKTNQESILTVKDFDLLTLKPFTNIELKGVANGELRLRDYYHNPYFISNLQIDQVVYKNSLIGTVSSEAVWDNLRNRLNINANVFRINQEIFRASGHYDPENKFSPLSLKAKIRNLNMQMLEGILQGVFSKLGGLAEGDFDINGTALNPLFKGEINVHRGTLKLDAAGTQLYFDDKIMLTEKGFLTPPKGLLVRDAAVGGNTAELQGGVFKGEAGKFIIDLNAYMKAKEGFKVLQLKNTNNESFYGTAYSSGDIHVSGDFGNVVVTGNLTSKKGTKITIPMDSKKNIDIAQIGIPFLAKNKVVDSTKIDKKSKIKTTGVKMAFNLNFTPDAECEIIFDRINNDILDVLGEGKITVVYDTRGEFAINGPFVVKSGKYNFSFQNLASLRKFNIVEGSRITWSGDPYEANIDLKASYTANIPIFKITSLASDANVRYPVNVMVSLKDRMLTPTIKYDIGFDLKQIPMASQTYLLGFEQKLRNDEQLLSRNVSSILVFNEIFPDNFTDAFTQQFLIDNVSNLLSNQIGNLANKLNPNLELGVQFGDFRANVLNNMQLNFSYRFLNNRVKLSGKSSFINAIENSINVSNQGQLSVGGELEYLLSPDGEYKFKLFSRSVPTNYYMFTSSGNVVVSGGNFIISRNFNSFFASKKNRPFPIGAKLSPKKEEEISIQSIQ
jgi:TamB, inner membrane protein subunit of TAM complex